MPAYTLHYFDVRGLGEVSRQLFALADLPFTDRRVSFEEWPALKETTPFGQMPILEVDGKKLPQSAAIARYLAKQFGYAGKTDFEAAWVDALGDQYKDYINDIRPFTSVLFGFAEGDKDAKLKEHGEPARDKHFALFEKVAKENGSGYLVGNSLTWIDLMIVDHMDALDGFIPGFYDGFPTLVALRKKVQSEPKIKAWLEKRPQTKF